MRNDRAWAEFDMMSLTVLVMCRSFCAGHAFEHCRKNAQAEQSAFIASCCQKETTGKLPGLSGP
jgi:hypothetical protein